MQNPKHLCLFSGIGALAKGVNDAGFETVAFCEKDSFCQKILRKHWKETKIWNSIQELNSSLVDSPAKTLVVQEKEGGLEEEVALLFGTKCVPPLKLYDPSMSSSKMLVISQEKDCLKSCTPLPQSGMMRNGIVYPLLNLERRTLAKDTSLLPTPVTSDATAGAVIGKKDVFYTTKSGLPRKINQNGVDGSVGLARLFRLTLGGFLHPRFAEWMMGLPIGWTELKPSGTQSSPRSLKL
jgi:hypothetical protein